MSATATSTIREVDFNGDIRLSVEPEEPAAGVLVDAHGAVIRSGWMSRASEKLSEPAGASKGFVAIVAIIPAALTLLITGALLLIGYGRGDQSQTEKINQILVNQSEQIKSLERMEGKYDRLDGRLRELERFIDRTGASKFLQEEK